MQPTLRLARDADTSAQSHLDEFAARSALILFALVLAGICWWLNSDALLSWYLTRLVPCEATECLRVFDPAQWIASRWMMILLLSCLVIMPLLAWQSVAFASVGLLPKEKVWMRRVFLYMPLVGGLVVMATLLYILPSIFAWGHSVNVGQGLATRYDAAEILSIAFTVAWLEMLVLFALCAIVFGGISGQINSHTITLWRIRIHGFTLGLMWLMMPEALSGTRLAIVLFSALLLEIAFAPFSRLEGWRVSLAVGEGILDDEAALRRVCFVDCSCAGACPSLAQSQLPAGTASHTARALCLSSEERDTLLERIRAERFSDVLISGCDSTPLPFQFRDSMDILGINLRGLSLMEYEASRTIYSKNSSLEISLAIAALNNPWSLSRLRQRQYSILSENPLPNELYFSEASGKIPWGLQLRQGVVFLSGVGPLSENIISLMHKNHIPIVNLEPN